MSAWVFALVCLFHTDACSGRNALPSTQLAVYLTASPSQSPSTVEHMKRELIPVLQNVGYQIRWNDPNHPENAPEAANLVLLELRGICDLPSGSGRMEPAVDSGGSLAETVVAARGVTRFVRVNCDNLTRMVGPSLSAEPGALREYLYGRAVARVVAHELYHVLMETTEHGRSGLARPSFTVADLLDEVFHFDAADIAKLRQKAVQPDSDVALATEAAARR
jgi:hypothetical protein